MACGALRVFDPAIGAAMKNAAVSRGVLGFRLARESQPSSFRTLVSAVMNRSISACVL